MSAATGARSQARTGHGILHEVLDTQRARQGTARPFCPVMTRHVAGHGWARSKASQVGTSRPLPERGACLCRAVPKRERKCGK